MEICDFSPFFFNGAVMFVERTVSGRVVFFENASAGVSRLSSERARKKLEPRLSPSLSDFHFPTRYSSHIRYRLRCLSKEDVATYRFYFRVQMKARERMDYQRVIGPEAQGAKGSRVKRPIHYQPNWAVGLSKKLNGECLGNFLQFSPSLLPVSLNVNEWENQNIISKIRPKIY